MGNTLIQYIPKEGAEILLVLFSGLITHIIGALVSREQYWVATTIAVLGVALLVMGVTDVDPFILSLAESASSLTPVTLAGGAIVIAAASNNFIKGAYAYGFGDRRTGTQGISLLAVLGLLGLLPLLL